MDDVVERFYFAGLDGGDSKLVAIFEPTVTPRASETIAMSVDVDAMHLFDAETSESLLRQ